MRSLAVTLLLVTVSLPALGEELRWHDDYAAAYRQAESEGRLLLVAFQSGSERFDPPAQAQPALERFVLARVPLDATLTLDDESSEPWPLLDFRAFRALKGKPGLAVVNLARTDRQYRRTLATLSMAEANRSAAEVVGLVEQAARSLGEEVLVGQFGLAWHTDYNQAYSRAKAEKKLLFLACDSDEVRFSPDRETAGRLRGLVLVRLPLAQSEKLFFHSGLRKFHCAEGVGVIDLMHEGPSHGKLVNAIPARYLTMQGVRTMIDAARDSAEPPPLDWHTDYLDARAEAESQGKMLLVAVDSDEEKYAPRPACVPVLQGYVLLREHRDEEYLVKEKRRRLIDFADFRDLRGQPGLVIYDFAHRDESTYGKVVSVMPYKYLRPKLRFRVFSEEEREHELLILEPGTLTRRTLTWAIRVSQGNGRNQRLRSADGRPHPRLMSGALRNSILQCGRGCGHFAGGLSGAEIASPGPGKDVVDGALNMVRIWKTSPPHYGVMVRFHRRFGYDMAASNRNHWYGTGRF